MLAGPGSAWAGSCSPGSGYSQLTAAQIANLLVGSLTCYPASPPYENQEALSGGKIVDYKKGPKDSADPRVTVGGFSINDGINPTITYTYVSGASFIYTVWGTTTSGSGTYDFCSGKIPVTVRVVMGSSGPC